MQHENERAIKKTSTLYW